MTQIAPILMLAISNIFMTFAWYGHLRDMLNKPLWMAIGVSWLIALLEYCFQVPANRIGAEIYSLPQLKIIQEVITLVVFVVFAMFYMGIKPTINFLWASLCMLGAVYFIFKDGLQA